jgi:hypothetical protein
MIEPNLPGLSVGKQCALLSIARSSFYYEPKGESEKRVAVGWSASMAITARLDAVFGNPRGPVTCPAETLRDHGIAEALVGIDGEMRAMGLRPDGKAWTIAVEAPDPERH